MNNKFSNIQRWNVFSKTLRAQKDTINSIHLLFYLHYKYHFLDFFFLTTDKLFTLQNSENSFANSRFVNSS